MTTIRSILFLALLPASVAVFAPLILMARPFGRSAAYSVGRGWSDIVLWSCRILCGIDFAVEGRENIPDDIGVVFIKHSSAYETIALFQFFPQQCWVVKRELIRLPFFGWALAALHSIAIDRNAGHSAVEQVIEQGKRRLTEGLWIMIFPEGTRMAPGETRRYGVSGTLLAQAAGRLIVPVAHNAGDFWPRRALRLQPGTVRFCIGPPIDPTGRKPREVNSEIQNWIETKVAELRKPMRGSALS